MALSNGPNLGVLVDGGIGETHYNSLMAQWRAFDGLIQARVVSHTLTTPPTTPADGVCYIVPTGSTGVWSTQTNKIARYSSKQSAWEFYTPKIGWFVYSESISRHLVFKNGSWSAHDTDKADLVNGKIPSNQLPSFVDDVIEFDTIEDLPEIGESGKIYVTLDSNNSWRWTGSTYQKVSQPLDEMPQAVAEAGTSETLYAATARRIRQAIAAWWLTASTAFGRTLANIADAAAGRAALGLGSIATQNASSVEVGTLSASGQIYSAANISDRFFNADGSVGADQANARNHFTQQNAGAATGVSTGWLSAAFGKADGGRLAFGQYGGKSYLVGHNGDLNGWDTVNIRGNELHYYTPFGETPSVRMGESGIDSLGSIKASSSSIGVQLMSGSEAKAFHLATLPASTEGTYDHLRIVGTSGAWESSSKSRFELIIGNRNGLTVRYLEGQLDAYRNISLHPLANGDVEVYAALVNYSTMELQMYGCGCTVNQPVVEKFASTAATWSAAGAYPRRQSRYDTERELITVNVDGTGGQELWNRSAGANAYVGTRLRNDINGDAGLFRLSSSNPGYAGPNSTMLWSGVGKIAIWNQGDDAIEFATSDVKRMTLDASGNLGLGVTPSAWGTVSIDISSGALAASGSTTQLSHNGYWGGAFKYKGNGFAAEYRLNNADGSHAWFTAGNNTSGANAPLTWTSAMTLDNAGNLGLGVVPSAWGTGESAYKVIQYGVSGFLAGRTANETAILGTGAYSDGANWRYLLSSNYASLYSQASGQHTWFTAPPGNAGDPISFTQTMTLFENGVLVVGEGNNSYHRINKPSSVADGTPILEISRFGTAGFAVFAVPGSYGSTAEAAAWVGASATTSRSINAVGTINASGADYAEYERNNGLVIGKGSVIGFKADGTLTLTYAEAIRFGIKSTNPSYVGGDVWGSEDQVGKRPDQPSYSAPTYTGPQAPVEPVKPAIQEGEEVNAEADDAAYLEALNAYQEQLTAYFDAQAAHKAAVEAAEAAHAEAMAQYEIDKAAFDERLEAARQTVDRIAYSGKVPVNVLGATPGGYIVAAEGETGEIVGEFVADPDFAQYKKAVGRVNRVLEDGRCEVAVIVH